MTENDSSWAFNWVYMVQQINPVFPKFVEVVSKPQIRFKGKALTDRESAAYM